jgi:hypothetical protein
MAKMRVPPGVGSGSFSKAIKNFKQIVGDEWVFTSDEDLNLYRDFYSPVWGEADERIASAAVAPNTADEVSAVVKVANDQQIPIYPISTGRDLAYGGSAPVYSGSVVLDLKRLNRVLDVSERNACALVEPGVSYFDLYRYIQERKLKLWIDPPDPGWGSPIGNSLDHGAGYTLAPYRDHFAAHCGMEIVLPNGEIMRTGMGAVPNSKTWQQFKYGVGPIVDGLFAQSNFGVVTKMGFWLMPEPEAYRMATVTAPLHDNIVDFMDILTSLIYAGVIDSQTIVTSPMYSGRKDAELAALHAKEGGASSGELDAYAKAKGIPFWTAQFKFYGLQKVIDAQWEQVQNRFSSIPGVQFKELEALRFPLTPEQVENVIHTPSVGIPSLRIFQGRTRTNPNPADAHADFSIVVPMAGEDALEALKVLSHEFATSGTDAMVGNLASYHVRAMILISTFPFYRNDPERNKRNRDFFAHMIKVCADRGWGQYRSHAIFANNCLQSYSFNNNVLHRFHETLKDAVDPNGIISAGRYGIWPKHLRKKMEKI